MECWLIQILGFQKNWKHFDIETCFFWLAFLSLQSSVATTHEIFRLNGVFELCARSSTLVLHSTTGILCSRAGNFFGLSLPLVYVELRQYTRQGKNFKFFPNLKFCCNVVYQCDMNGKVLLKCLCSHSKWNCSAYSSLR